MPGDDNAPTLFVDLFFGVTLTLLLAFYGWKYREIIKTTPNFWKHRASLGWPLASATFDDGQVRIRRGKGGTVSYSVFVKFTYRVAGETYHGWYWKAFGTITKKQADNVLQSLREGPLYVRYRPAQPKDYVCDPLRDVRP